MQLKPREIHKIMHDFFEPWHNRDFHVLWLVLLGSMVFLAVCWEPIERLAYPFIAINMAVGWTTYYVGIKKIWKLSVWSKQANRIIPCLLMLYFYSQIDHASRFKIAGGRQDPRIQIGLQPRARDL